MAKLGQGIFKDPDSGELTRKREIEFTPVAADISADVRAKREAPAEADTEEFTSAASYSQSVKKRQLAVETAKSLKRPLGGGPPLDRQKMGQLAAHLGSVKGTIAGPTFPPLPGSAEAGDLPAPPRPPRLPPEQLPQKRVKGVGAALEYNQAMARGEIDKPQSLAQAKRMEEEGREDARSPPAPKMTFSPTPQAQKIMNAMSNAPQQPIPQKPQEQPVPELQSEEAARAATVAAAEEEMVRQSVEELLAPRLDELDEVRRILLDPKRRKIIEERLEPLDISDLIFDRQIQQEITVIPDKFSLTLKTVREYENLFVLERMYGVRNSEAYIQELLNMYKVTCALVAINGSPLPDHRAHPDTPEEQVDKAKFEHKFNIILGQATPILAEIGVQYDWFIVRVNRLLSSENLKNG